MAAQKPWADFTFVRAEGLLLLTHTQRFQELNSLPQHLLVSGREVDFPIAISHRWANLQHPDPNSDQLHALQFLLRSISHAAAALYAKDAEERRRIMPDVRVHGVLQAVMLASRFFCPHNVPADRASSLAGVGVWYDYMCLPQWPR